MRGRLDKAVRTETTDGAVKIIKMGAAWMRELRQVKGRSSLA